jgi:hypothetical protein
MKRTPQIKIIRRALKIAPGDIASRAKRPRR